jgi:hypothetical protein
VEGLVSRSEWRGNAGLSWWLKPLHLPLPSSPSRGICFLRHERLTGGKSWKGLSGGGFLDGSIFCRTDVRLAHQLMSGRSDGLLQVLVRPRCS